MKRHPSIWACLNLPESTICKCPIVSSLGNLIDLAKMTEEAFALLDENENVTES